MIGNSLFEIWACIAAAALVFSFFCVIVPVVIEGAGGMGGYMTPRLARLVVGIVLVVIAISVLWPVTVLFLVLWLSYEFVVASKKIISVLFFV